MIVHECENGQRVAFPTAESSKVENGFIYFFDANGHEVGRQPYHTIDVEPQLNTDGEPPEEPPVPPVTAAAAPEHEHDAT